MVFFEFGKAEKQKLEPNSVYISFNSFGWDEKGRQDWNNALRIIKEYWNRIFHGKPTNEWESPASCWQELRDLYEGAGLEIYYKNDPPKSNKVTNDDILNGMDFNGYNLYDYQLQGVKFGLEHPNFLLLDEQRITEKHYKLVQ